jgi:hypothetical protein
MTTSALYTPDNRILELGQVTESDLRLLESLRGNIKRGQNILLCQHPGGDPEMFVWRDSRTGWYWVKVLRGGRAPWWPPDPPPDARASAGYRMLGDRVV